MSYDVELHWSWGRNWRFQQTERFSVDKKEDIDERVTAFIERMALNYTFDCSRLDMPLHPTLNGLTITPIGERERQDTSRFDALLVKAMETVEAKLLAAQERKTITCPRCGRTSHNPSDVRERYCGYCHVFLDDPAPPPRGSFLEWKVWSEDEKSRINAELEKETRMTNHFDVVDRLHSEQPPARTLEGALGFLLRVVRALPESEAAAGLLLKPGGENIVDYNGRMVSASRICYPNGAIVKVLTDVPSTNGPSWQDDGEVVDADRYVAVIGSSEPPAAGNGDGNAAVHPETQIILDRLGALAFEAFTKMDTIEANLNRRLDELQGQSAANSDRIMNRIDQVVEDAEKTLGELRPVIDGLKRIGL